MEKKKYEDTFEQDVEMLKYFQGEFEFRHAHYWNLYIKFFLLTTIIAIFPLTGEIFSMPISEVPNKYLICFPILSAIVAVLGLIVLLGEARKIGAVNSAKYRINRSNMDPKYHYVFYNDNAETKGEKTGRKDDKKPSWLSFRMPWLAFALEVIIILFMSFILLG